MPVVGPAPPWPARRPVERSRIGSPSRTPHGDGEDSTASYRPFGWGSRQRRLWSLRPRPPHSRSCTMSIAVALSRPSAGTTQLTVGQDRRRGCRDAELARTGHHPPAWNAPAARPPPPTVSASRSRAWCVLHRPRTSSAANFSTAVNGVFSGTLNLWRRVAPRSPLRWRPVRADLAVGARLASARSRPFGLPRTLETGAWGRT